MYIAKYCQLSSFVDFKSCRNSRFVLFSILLVPLNTNSPKSTCIIASKGTV